MRDFLILLGFALKQQLRQPGDSLMPPAFFLLFCVIFAIAGQQGVGVIWVGALLALFLAAPSLYQQEWREGVLDQLALQLPRLELFVLAKCIAQLAAVGVPLGFGVPFGMMFLGMDWSALATISGALAVGVIATCALLNLAASLMLGYGNAPLVRLGIVMPLCVPTMIFGIGASQHAPQAMPLLAAYACLISPVCIWASAYGLRAQIADS